MDAAIPAAEAIPILQALTPIRYLIVSGMSLVLWDTVLTVEREIKDVWRRLSLVLRFAYGFNRYGVMFMLFIAAANLLPTVGTPANSRCDITTGIVAVIYCLADVIGNILTIFRVFILWDRDRSILRWLIIGSTLAFACNASLTAVITAKLVGQQHWLPRPIEACVIAPGAQSEQRKLFLGTWIAQLMFEMYGATLVVLNCLKMPRRDNKDLWRVLEKDGILLILAVFASRIVNITLTVQNNAEDYLISVVFLSAVISTANSRLVLGLCEHHTIEDLNSHELVERRTKTGQSYFTFRTLKHTASHSVSTTTDHFVA